MLLAVKANREEVIEEQDKQSFVEKGFDIYELEDGGVALVESASKLFSKEEIDKLKIELETSKKEIDKLKAELEKVKKK